jgi:hypothetical protein
MKYHCPLCKSELTKEHFHKVVKIQEEKEKVQQGDLEKLKKQIATKEAAVVAAKKRAKEAKLKAKQNAEEARKQGALLEQRKSAIRDKRLMSRIKKLEEEKKMLQKHTSPQEIGLADEKVLVSRLEKEFPDDNIQHEGKEGDVLHFVKFNGENSGCIVYECKHTDRIATAHIEQIASDKKTRQANYGILVTTGTRKGFSGLDQESGVFIVAQAGVLTLARICRESLVTMAKQRLDAEQKEIAAKRLMDYVTSPVCKTPLEEAISQAERAHKNLGREIKQHIGDWKERHEIYGTIHHDISHIEKNIGRVLDGKEPLKLEKPKFEPLALQLPS